MTVRTGLAVTRDGSGNGTTPQGMRLGLGGLLATNGASGVDIRQGILWDTAGPVVAGTAGMAYSVRACRAVVMPSATQGPVIVPNDAAISLNTTAAPGSNSRIDVIWCRQHLVSADGGSDTDVIGEWGVTQGTVAASPTAPAIPTGAIEVARATVTAGATATNTLTISQTHLWTCATGAPIPVRSQTERDALTAYAGMMVNRLDSSILERYDGSGWKQVGGIGWSTREDLTSKLAAGFTVSGGGAFDIRRNGVDREIRGTISGTIASSGSTNIVAVAGMAAGDRPNLNSFAFAYLSSGMAGSAFIRADGSIAIANMSGSARTTAQFLLRYTVES